MITKSDIIEMTENFDNLEIKIDCINKIISFLILDNFTFSYYRLRSLDSQLAYIEEIMSIYEDIEKEIWLKYSKDDDKL